MPNSWTSSQLPLHLVLGKASMKCIWCVYMYVCMYVCMYVVLLVSMHVTLHSTAHCQISAARTACDLKRSGGGQGDYKAS